MLRLGPGSHRRERKVGDALWPSESGAQRSPPRPRSVPHLLLLLRVSPDGLVFVRLYLRRWRGGGVRLHHAAEHGIPWFQPGIFLASTDPNVSQLSEDQRSLPSLVHPNVAFRPSAMLGARGPGCSFPSAHTLQCGRGPARGLQGVWLNRSSQRAADLSGENGVLV